MKTQQYQQPNYYHFSQSVVEAAQWISSFINFFSYSTINLTDLFAGSGVFSIELMHRLPKTYVKSWNLIEMQTAFSSSLAFNISNFLNPIDQYSPQTFYTDSLSWMKDKNLKQNENEFIILNPPHYFEDEGKLPLNQDKRKCVSIKKDYWDLFLQECKKSNAKFFFLLNHQTQLYLCTQKSLKAKIKLIQPLAGNDCLLVIL